MVCGGDNSSGDCRFVEDVVVDEKCGVRVDDVGGWVWVKILMKSESLSMELFGNCGWLLSVVRNWGRNGVG